MAQMSQVPIYVQYLTAISTPIIALMVAAIAFAQWRTAHQRMILDLFQRRMDLVDLVSRIASSIVMEGALRNEDVDGFLRARRGDEFLFGPEVTTYLEDTYKRLTQLHAYEKVMERAQGEERKQLVEKRGAIRNELTRFNETFHTLVTPYVRMNQKLRWIDQYL
jgi:hypothetical protein